MPVKPVVILVIDNLGKGGAEMLLVGILEDLSDKYDLKIVTLTERCDFEKSDFEQVRLYNLNATGKLSYPSAIFKLKKIIKKYNPLFVHSHLVYSTIIARLACPANIPLLFSVHNEIGHNVFRKNLTLSLFEKLTIRKTQTLIAVSKTVLKDYNNAIEFPGKQFVLENYIKDEFYIQQTPPKEFVPGEMMKVVALGNIKDSKNYEYLVKSFISLKDHNVSLDIYGNKDEVIYPQLQTLITEHGLNVFFKGPANDIPAVFSNYHLYIMSSKHEGFGIAAIEAMACKLPLLLSDLEVLKEVTESNAIFFSLDRDEDLSDKIKKMLNGEFDLRSLSSKGIEISKKYRRQEYLQKLSTIYEDAVRTK